MGNVELLEPEHARAAPRDVVARRRPHRAHARKRPAGGIVQLGAAQRPVDAIAAGDEDLPAEKPRRGMGVMSTLRGSRRAGGKNFRAGRKFATAAVIAASLFLNGGLDVL